MILIKCTTPLSLRDMFRFEHKPSSVNSFSFVIYLKMAYVQAETSHFKLKSAVLFIRTLS